MREKEKKERKREKYISVFYQKLKNRENDLLDISHPTYIELKFINNEFVLI